MRMVSLQGPGLFLNSHRTCTIAYKCEGQNNVHQPKPDVYQPKPDVYTFVEIYSYACCNLRLGIGLGFDLLDRLHPFDCKVIFISAHRKYAKRALGYKSLGYLLEPVDPD